MLLDKGAPVIDQIDETRLPVSTKRMHEEQRLWPPLEKALRIKDFGLVGRLLEAGATVNYRNYSDCTHGAQWLISQPLPPLPLPRLPLPRLPLPPLPLPRRRRLQRKSELELLPRIICSSVPPIILAIQSGNIQLVQDFIDMGADINSTFCEEHLGSHEVYSALSLSILKMNAAVNLLLDAGANVNNILLDDRAKANYRVHTSRIATTIITPLTAAITINDEVMFEKLISLGANPNDPEAMFVAIRDNSKFFTKLHETCTKIYSGGTRGYCSVILAKAIRKNDQQLIDKILAIGPDVNTIVEISNSRFNLTTKLLHFFSEKISPLGVAITQKHDNALQITERLLRAGGDPDSIVERRMVLLAEISRPIQVPIPALIAAVETGNLLIIQLLIKEGANVNHPAKFGTSRTPLQLASQLGNFDIVQILLKANADVNGEPSFRAGGTALQLAAIEGYVGVAELLLEWGANPNGAASRVEGRTAMEGAAEYGRIDMLKLLYNAGAIMNQQQFERAQRYTELNGHLATKKYLETLYPEFLTAQSSIPSSAEECNNGCDNSSSDDTSMSSSAEEYDNDCDDSSSDGEFISEMKGFEKGSWFFGGPLNPY